MKKVLLPHVNGGSVWTVTHRLMLASERYRQIRPIHIWTFLGFHITPPPIKNAGTLFMAIENKLFGVRLARSRLRRSLSYTLDQCYAHGNVQDYEGEHQVMFELEAYLNAIYTTLEIVSVINKLQDNTLPQGFRKQVKRGKFPLFKFELWQWLPLFYDLRTLFTHYGSSFPLLREGAFELDIDTSSEWLYFTRGKQQRVAFDKVLSFADNLFGLLDVWSLHKLQAIDPTTKVFQIHQRSFVGPMKARKGTAKPFLRLAQEFQHLLLNSPGFPDLKKLIEEIHIKCD